MTRIAIISDVHGDDFALEEALARISELRCERVVCAGDLVGLGPAAERTVELLRRRELPVIRGDHDAWAVCAPEGGGRGPDREWLRILPRSWQTAIDGVRVAMWHAGPGGDTEGIDADLVSVEEAEFALDQARADVLVVGHTHAPMCLEVEGKGRIVNPGALLRAKGSWLSDPVSGIMAPAPVGGGGLFGVLTLPTCSFDVYRASDGSEVEIARRKLE